MVALRSGMKYLATLPVGAEWRVVNGRVVVIAPEEEPFYLNGDGTKEVIKPGSVVLDSIAPAESVQKSSRNG